MATLTKHTMTTKTMRKRGNGYEWRVAYLVVAPQLFATRLLSLARHLGSLGCMRRCWPGCSGMCRLSINQRLLAQGKQTTIHTHTLWVVRVWRFSVKTFHRFEVFECVIHQTTVATIIKKKLLKKKFFQKNEKTKWFTLGCRMNQSNPSIVSRTNQQVPEHHQFVCSKSEHPIRKSEKINKIKSYESKQW